MSSFYLSSIVLLLALAIIGNNYATAAELDLDSIPPPLGTCVTSSSDGPVPEDLWATTEIMKDSTKYPPFQKYIETRGIVLAAISEEAVSDVFLQQVATTLNEMIPNNDAYDREQQETMIATLARKRTLIPIVPVEGFGALSEAEFQQMDQIQDTYSSCDMIFELGMENPRQPMEVVEHLLHHLNLIGLHYLLPEQWGMTPTSQLSDELEVSGQQQYFDVAGYEASFPEASEEEIMDILLKQYSFWLLATWMDVVADYGPNDVENEWQLFTPALLEADQPSAWALCEDYLKTLFAVPTNLAEYGPTAEDLQVAAEAVQEWEDQVQQAEAAAMAAVAAAFEADPLRPLGNCVSTTDDGPIPADLWSTTEIIVDSTTYPPFQKYIETRGMIFAAISDDTISDDFLTKVATTVTQLIPNAAESATYNRTKQEEMITILAQKRTLIPIVPIGNIFGDLSQEESAQLDQIQDDYSSCDVIIQLAAGDPNQPMEVVKHVLHHVNMIGLNYLMYDQWGMSPQSVLFTQLVEALQQEYFSIPPYQDEMGNYQNIALDPIPLQQYSYWLLSTWMDLVVDYGPPVEVVEEEWQLYTPALLQEQQPQAYALCVETLTDILATPTNLPEYATITTTTAAAAAAAAEEEDVPATVAVPVPPSPTNVLPAVVPQTLAPTTTPVVVVVPEEEEEGVMKEEEEKKELEPPPPEVVAARVDDTGEDEGTTTTNDNNVVVADTDADADAVDPATLLEEDALLSASSASASTTITTIAVLVVMGLTTMITMV